LLILDVIHDVKRHLTTEDIIGDIQFKMPGVNKSTIYRTLELLEKAGCVYKSELGGEFIYHHEEEGNHHHLVCSWCGKTIDCDENLFMPVQWSLREKYNFSVDFNHIVMRGLCEECRSKDD
jgi:Fur family ferric uptake transcriptional regulator